MPLVFVWISGIAGALFATICLAQGFDAQPLCGQLQRPNIDCACVAKRLESFNQLSPNAAAMKMINQGYLYALGQDNSYEEALMAVMGNPMAAMAVLQAYDPVGGAPGECD